MFIFKRSGIYHLQYFSQSENRIKRISTEATKKQDALRFLNEFSEVLQNQRKTQFISLKDFISQYQKFVESTLSKHSLRSVVFSFNNLLRTIPGETPLAKITVNEFEKFFIEHPSKSTALLFNRTIKAALNKAIQWNYISENPLNKFKLPKLPQKINLYLSASEFEIILKYEPDQLFRDIFTFAYSTGTRLAELVNLKWSAVNLKDKLIKIANTKDFTTKGGKERIIPINVTLHELLTTQAPKVFNISDSYVFNIRGFKITHDLISKRFKKALRKANINGASINPLLHYHNLRGSFITNLAKRNVPLHIIQKLVGHENVTVTSKYYLSVQNESMFEAMRTLDTTPGKRKVNEI